MPHTHSQAAAHSLWVQLHFFFGHQSSTRASLKACHMSARVNECIHMAHLSHAASTTTSIYVCVCVCAFPVACKSCKVSVNNYFNNLWIFSAQHVCLSLCVCVFVRVCKFYSARKCAGVTLFMLLTYKLLLRDMILLYFVSRSAHYKRQNDNRLSHTHCTHQHTPYTHEHTPIPTPKHTHTHQRIHARAHTDNARKEATLALQLQAIHASSICVADQILQIHILNIYHTCIQWVIGQL